MPMHASFRFRRNNALLFICLLVAACTSRPVPRLERAMDSFEAEYDRVREISDSNDKALAYGALRDEVQSFRSELATERELDPEARGHAIAQGWGARVRLDRRDVSSIRDRADRLLRSLNRYLSTRTPPGLSWRSKPRNYSGAA
jgi:hypothetical protein